MKQLSAALFVPWVLVAAACGDDIDNPQTPTEPGLCEPAPAATTETLQWKGFTPMMNDLAAALELTPEEVCVELGTIQCESLYNVTLGGTAPISLAVYEPAAMPLPTTPIAVERAALSACLRRVAIDAEAANPAVFNDIDLNAPALAPTAPEVAAQIRTLYRRLLRRDASEAELNALAALAGPSTDDGSTMSARDFAATACFAIATTTEFLFI